MTETRKKLTQSPKTGLLAGASALALAIALPGYLAINMLGAHVAPASVLEPDYSEHDVANPVGERTPDTRSLLNLEPGEASNVPRVFLARLPDDLPKVKQVSEKKQLFVNTLLPIVLRANEMILGQRNVVKSLKAQVESGLPLEQDSLAFLRKLEKRFRVKPGKGGRDAAYFNRLLKRVDIVPPSLAITQAAIESGWGTSRFARKGNALFGEWTWDENASGMDPLARQKGKTHRIKTFDYLIDSVASYMTNLNRHRAYQDFRDRRKALRDAGKPIEGRPLAQALTSYSERGYRYVEDVVQIMDYNKFALLDRLALEQES